MIHNYDSSYDVTEGSISFRSNAINGSLSVLTIFFFVVVTCHKFFVTIFCVPNLKLCLYKLKRACSNRNKKGAYSAILESDGLDYDLDLFEQHDLILSQSRLA